MDKEKGGKGGSKGRRVSEIAAVVVIIVSLVLVGAELAVNVLNEMERNTGKSETASYVVRSPDLRDQPEAQ